MNLRNKMNFIRILLIPVFLIFIIIHKIPFGRSIAALIFIITAIAGELSKHVVQSKNEISNLSEIMSYLADKLLIAAALIALVELHVIPSWIAIIIVAMEFAVTGLTSIVVTEGSVIATSSLDKIKNIFQIISIIFALLSMNFQKNYQFRKVIEKIGFFHVHAEGIKRFLGYGTYATLGIALIITIISCINYFVSNKGLFMNDK